MRWNHIRNQNPIRGQEFFSSTLYMIHLQEKNNKA